MTFAPLFRAVFGLFSVCCGVLAAFGAVLLIAVVFGGFPRRFAVQTAYRKRRTNRRMGGIENLISAGEVKTGYLTFLGLCHAENFCCVSFHRAYTGLAVKNRVKTDIFAFHLLDFRLSDRYLSAELILMYKSRYLERHRDKYHREEYDDSRELQGTFLVDCGAAHLFDLRLNALNGNALSFFGLRFPFGCCGGACCRTVLLYARMRRSLCAGRSLRVSLARAAVSRAGAAFISVSRLSLFVMRIAMARLVLRLEQVKRICSRIIIYRLCYSS